MLVADAFREAGGRRLDIDAVQHLVAREAGWAHHSDD
jgi:hypothetical protein